MHRKHKYIAENNHKKRIIEKIKPYSLSKYPIVTYVHSHVGFSCSTMFEAAFCRQFKDPLSEYPFIFSGGVQTHEVESLLEPFGQTLNY